MKNANGTRARRRLRYEVVMYASDCGYDESRDFSSIREARKYLSRLLQSWEAGAVFDRAKRRYIHADGKASHVFDAENVRLATAQAVVV